MFFIFGVNTKEKKVREWQMTCPECEQKATFTLYVRYSYFSLFFIPIIKWGYEFWVVNSCCNDVYTISKDLGKECMWDEDEPIRAKDLKLVQKTTRYHCKWCGAKLDRLSRYCPECGKEL